MSWTPVTLSLDCRDAAVAAEYEAACAERADVLACPAVPDLCDVGDDARAATGFWRQLQDWLEERCVEFLADADEGAFDGLDAMQPFTLNTWRTAAGIPDGFRRATTWPADWTDYEDPAYSYGKMEDGDIRGPWILADLQAGFNVLEATAHAAAGVADTTDNYRFGESGYKSTWTAAKAEAEANYAAFLDDDGGLPFALYGGFNSGGSYKATVQRATNKVTWNSPSEIERDVDWYMMGGIGDTGWDGNGDFAAHGPDVYHLWLTDNDVTDETVVSSAAFGSLTLPNVCPAPSGSEQIGYEIPGGGAKAVARWHFTYHA